MKRIHQTLIIISSILCFTAFSHAQNNEILTNEKVIKLHKAGFSKEVLMSKIQTSQREFDLTIDGMLELKKAGVSNDVINYMIESPKSSTISNQRSQPEKIGTATRPSSGIYYKTVTGEPEEIEPSILTGNKADRTLQFVLGGIFNAKVKATLSDESSSFVVRDSKPTFLFVFDTTETSSLNKQNNKWASSTRSPKEFLLVKLQVQDNAREITVGKANVVSGKSGIDNKYIIHFTSKKIGKGYYEITAANELEEGEYCFMFAEGIKEGESSKVFDFSIKKLKGF